MYHIAEASIEHPDELVCDVVFPVASETLLSDLIKEYQSKGPAFRKGETQLKATAQSCLGREIAAQTMHTTAGWGGG